MSTVNNGLVVRNVIEYSLVVLQLKTAIVLGQAKLFKMTQMPIKTSDPRSVQFGLSCHTL